MFSTGGFAPRSIQPAMGPENYQTYAIVGKRRRARCDEVGCPRHELGWLTVVDEATELGQRRAVYIRRLAERRFRERREGGLTHFEFYPGQQCFEQHYVSLEVDPLFLRRGGDFRGDPRGEGTFQHKTYDDWANDFGSHQEKLRKAQS